MCAHEDSAYELIQTTQFLSLNYKNSEHKKKLNNNYFKVVRTYFKPFMYVINI